MLLIFSVDHFKFSISRKESHLTILRCRKELHQKEVNKDTNTCYQAIAKCLNNWVQYDQSIAIALLKPRCVTFQNYMVNLKSYT